MTTAVTRERMITFLLETPMFENLDPLEIVEILHIVEVQLFQAGESIFNEGDPGDAWYVLYKGKIEVLKKSGSDEKLISTLGPGACFGEIAILDGLPRSATIRACENSVVFRVPRSAFDALIDNGNHLVMAGNRATFAYLDAIGARERLATTGPAAFPFFDLATGERWTVRPNGGPLPWWLFSPSRRAAGTRARD